jgi:hypothetical protein
MHSALQFVLSSQSYSSSSSSSSLSPSLLLLYLAAAGQQEGSTAGMLLSAAVFQLILGCTKLGKLSSNNNPHSFQTTTKLTAI